MCGSVFGLLSMALTCTYLPPIWLITFAYSFSAPTAVMVALELAAAVDPEPAEHAEPSRAIPASRAAHAAGWRKVMAWSRLRWDAGGVRPTPDENDNRYDF